MPPGGRRRSSSPTRGWPVSCARRAPRTSSRSRPARSTIRPGSGPRRSTTWGSTGNADRPPRWTSRAARSGRRWWSGGAFNYAIAATKPRADARPDGGAVAWEGEDGSIRRLTNRELATEVERAARMFAAQGVSAGDRVGVFLPMLPETVIAMLALAGSRRSSRRSSRATARRPSRPGCATARRASSSPPTASSAAAAASR